MFPKIKIQPLSATCKLLSLATSGHFNADKLTKTNITVRKEIVGNSDSNVNINKHLNIYIYVRYIILYTIIYIYIYIYIYMTKCRTNFSNNIIYAHRCQVSEEYDFRNTCRHHQEYMLPETPTIWNSLEYFWKHCDLREMWFLIRRLSMAGDYI